MTSMPGVFAAGDMFRGQSLVVGDSRRSAGSPLHRQIPHGQHLSVLDSWPSDFIHNVRNNSSAEVHVFLTIRQNAANALHGLS